MYSMKIIGIVYIRGEFKVLWASIGRELLRVKYVGNGMPDIGNEVLAEGRIVVDPQMGRQFVALGFRPMVKGEGRSPRVKLGPVDNAV